MNGVQLAVLRIIRLQDFLPSPKVRVMAGWGVLFFTDLHYSSPNSCSLAAIISILFFFLFLQNQRIPACCFCSELHQRQRGQTTRLRVSLSRGHPRAGQPRLQLPGTAGAARLLLGSVAGLSPVSLGYHIRNYSMNAALRVQAKCMLCFFPWGPPGSSPS